MAITFGSFAVKLITFSDFKANQESIKNIDSALFFSSIDYKEYFDENIVFRLSVIEPDNNLKNLNDISQIFEEAVSGNDYLRIIGVQPNSITVEVTKPNTFKEKNETFSMGSFVKVTDDNNNAIIGMLQSFKSIVNTLNTESRFLSTSGDFSNCSRTSSTTLTRSRRCSS